MILQTGLRTDIPAFYSTWLLNRVKETFVLVRNPYNPQRVTRYRIDPEVVDMIAFCTKNPSPLLPHLDAFRPFGQYWFVTITPYGRDIEPNVPLKEQVMDDFRWLADVLGPECMGWRYDPILVDRNHPVDWHLEQFEHMAETLRDATTSCVISFIDIYKKVERNFPEIGPVSPEDRLTLGKAMIAIANRNGMALRPCAEGRELEPYGADCSGCLTVATFEAALHAHLQVPKQQNRPRSEKCACLLGTDIGAYDTCGHLCRYCYANANNTLVRENLRRHNPASPFLIGGPLPGDEIHDAVQESWRDGQLRLEL